MAAWWKFWASDEDTDTVEVLDGKGKKVKGGIPQAITLLNDRLTKLEKTVEEMTAPPPVVKASVKKGRRKV